MLICLRALEYDRKKNEKLLANEKISFKMVLLMYTDQI